MSTRNDAILLTVDQLHFKWPTFKRFRAYLVGVAADNLGNVQVTEYPGSHRIIHRPLKDRPHVWDMGHDGYMLYNTTGGLPDIVAYSLMLVRDRGTARNVGEIIGSVKQHHHDDIAQLRAIASSLPVAAVGAQVVGPAVNIVGGVLANLRDKVLDTVQGAKFFGPDEKAMSVIDDRVSGSLCDATFEFNLFDAEQDEDTQADITASKKQLERANAMLSV